MRLLALDTATELCSAALWLEGRVRSRAEERPRAHAELILPMIDSLLKEAGVSLRSLDAIAFGRGPGAFTGVRLALSVAQGLAFPSERPLLPVSDLRAVAQQALELHRDARAVLVCQDARMQQVYWGLFRAELDAGRIAVPGGPEAVDPPEAVALPEAGALSDMTGLREAAASAHISRSSAIGAGTGFGAYPSLAARFESTLGAIEPQLRPHAREIARLAAAEGLGAAIAPDRAEAMYLRDQVTTRESRN